MSSNEGIFRPEVGMGTQIFYAGLIYLGTYRAGELILEAAERGDFDPAVKAVTKVADRVRTKIRRAIA